MRYAHNIERVLGIPSQAVALLTTLMLRGTQTVGELRINCERLHPFADVSAVDGFLHELAERADDPLVAELPRGAPARETGGSSAVRTRECGRRDRDSSAGGTR